jgi:hypothetical protein
MITQPMEGEVVTDPRPLLKANLATLGDIEPASLSVRLSGVGPLVAKYDQESKNFEARPGAPLKPGDYAVIVSAKAAGKKVETTWRFKVAAK